MFQYQIYPSRNDPSAVFRAEGGHWGKAEVFSEGKWVPSHKGGELFGGFSSTSGDDISEAEALEFLRVPKIDAVIDEWIGDGDATP